MFKKKLSRILKGSKKKKLKEKQKDRKTIINFQSEGQEEKG